jgi:uncharacterized protein
MDDKPQFVPTYKVRFGGTELNPTDDAHLQEVRVELRRQAPASVIIQFNNHDGTYDSRDDMAPGAVVEVSLGYTERGNTKVFEGEVIGTHVRVSENGPRLFQVRAFDYLHRLTRGRKTRTFLDQKFSDILSTVARDRGLTPDVEDTKFVREYVIQHNQTDLDFARGVAGWLDFDLHICHLEDPKKLRFRAPEVGGAKIVKAQYEKPDLPAGDIYLRKFDGRQSLARVVSEVVVRGWDPATKAEIIGKAANAQLYDAMGGNAAPQELAAKWGETDRQLVDYKVFSEEEAIKIAETKLNEYARTFIRADVEVQGDPQIRPGGIVEIGRVGDKFDGPYFVETCTHVFGSKVQVSGGYTTRFTAARCGW